MSELLLEWQCEKIGGGLAQGGDQRRVDAVALQLAEIRSVNVWSHSSATAAAVAASAGRDSPTKGETSMVEPTPACTVVVVIGPRVHARCARWPMAGARCMAFVVRAEKV